jgi:hypothetical protein
MAQKCLWAETHEGHDALDDDDDENFDNEPNFVIFARLSLQSKKVSWYHS